MPHGKSKSRHFVFRSPPAIIECEKLTPGSKIRQPTTAKYEDCVNALGDLRAYPGNVTLQNNTCLNWWEGSCLVKVCAVQGRYSGNAAQIADTMTAMLLDPCIKQGKSGVESDCANVNGQCGAYRYWLTEYGGDFDWAV